MTHLLTNKKWTSVALVLGSLLLSFWHFGPLEGSLASLLLIVGGQVFLFGHLAARAFGIFRESEKIVIRLTWIVACGLGITIVIGAVARLLLLPVSVYVVGIHVLMFLFCLKPAVVSPMQTIQRQELPFYLLLATTCLVFVFVGWERNRMRFDYYPDQALPVSLADYWAHTAQPESLATRNIADTYGRTYWSSDGLTYVFAAWVWSGGFSAVQLIWYALTPLFVWLVPLAHFAYVYQLTRRADTAAWATGAVTILALTTIMPTTDVGGLWNFGQEAAFQLSTLRTFSTALLMPLVLFVFFGCLRTPALRYYLLVSVVMLALALTHPRQYLAMLTALGAALGIGVLITPSKARFRTTLILGFMLLPSLLVPIWQYASHLGTAVEGDVVGEVAAAVNISTHILSPQELLFNPLIALAMLLAVLSILRLRRSQAAQFIFATSLAMFTISYIPPIFNAIRQILGSYFGLHYVLELLYIVPYGLIFGISVSLLQDWLSRRLRYTASIGNWLIAVGFVGIVLVSLIEPFPLQKSARDQLNAAHEIQLFRDIRPFDELLLNRLSTLAVTQDKVVYLTSNRIGSYVIESVQNSFITGGRSGSNPAFAGSSRFFDARTAPWLDAEDIEFLETYAVDYLVLSADNTRLPQLLLQPERFEWIDSTAGYIILQVREIGPVTEADRYFAEMNTLYQAETSRRWDETGFHLDVDAQTRLWQPMTLEWRDLLEREPQNDLARYGLAFAMLMAGSDQNDLWAALSASHPDNFLLAEANTRLLAAQGEAQTAIDVLVSHLRSNHAEERTLAAKTLLSEAFFSLLTSEQLDMVLAAAETDSATWMHLMEWQHAEELRMRAALLMSANRLDVAAEWLSRIPQVDSVPRDWIGRAAIRLVQGDQDAIQSVRQMLQPSTDPDWILPQRTLHWDVWPRAGSAAAQFYHSLTAPAASILSPTLIAETGAVFAMQPEIEQQADQLQVTFIAGDFAPALPPRRVLVRVTSPDGNATYGETAVDIDIPPGNLQQVVIPVDLASSIASETPAQIVIEPQYSEAVIYQNLRVETVLFPNGQ